MNLETISATSMVISAMLYLIAMVLHSLEWSASRNLSATRPEDGSQDTARRRVDGYSRMAIVATVAGLITHLVAVVTRGIAAQRAPWGNMYEFSTSALLAVAIIYVFLVWRFGFAWLGLFVTGVLTVGQGLGVTVFYVAIAPLMPALHSVWFIVHIVMAIVAGAAFNIAAAASLIYLLRLRANAKAGDQPVRGYLARFDLKRVDTLAYRMTAFAFPVWTFTIAAGSIWAQYAWGRYWNWDPKETWSLVTWVVYAAYLHARATAGWRGKPAAIVSLVGFAAFWFNFIGVNLLFSGMHAYSGI